MTIDHAHALRAVAPEDMLFSTTDRRGIIQRANDAFSRIAQHPLTVLIGAPHNIVRHPGMPGGVFRILWHAIQAGEATGAYVLNRAGDGSGYWTFTSISPTGERYISVRTRPMREELLAFVWHIYEDARARERAARADGATAAQAAQLGEARILDRLAQRGFPSYRAFLHYLLPSEAEARIAAIGELAAPGGQGDRALLPVRTMVAEIERSMRELVLSLAASHEHAIELNGAVMNAERSIRDLGESLRSLGEEIEAMGRDRVPMLVDAGAPLRERCVAVDESVRRVTVRAGAVTEVRGSLRFSAATARTQAEMMLRAVDALILDPSRGDVTADAVEGLAQAVRGGLAAVVRALETDRARFAEARGELERNGAALRIMQLTVTSWRRMIDNYGLTGALAALPGFDAALEATTTHIGGIGTALEACAGDAIRLDRERIEDHLHRAVGAMR